MESELKDGRLVVPLRHSFDTGRTFYLVCPQDAAENPVLQVFRDWLLTHAAPVRR